MSLCVCVSSVRVQYVCVGWRWRLTEEEEGQEQSATDQGPVGGAERSVSCGRGTERERRMQSLG